MKKKLIYVVILLSLLTGCVQDIDKKDTTNREFDDGNDLAYESFYEKEDALVIENDRNSGINETINDTTTISESRYTSRDFTDEEKSLLKKSFFINDNVNDSIKKIESIIVNYPYSELYEYNGQFANEKYTPINASLIIENNKVNYDKLYSTVKQNNEAYMNLYNVKNYQSTTDSFIQNVCKNIKEFVDKYLELGIIDVPLMNEKLNDLKIFSFSDYANGFYNSEKGILALNINSVNDVSTITHEISHIIQSASINELDTSDYIERFGFCYKSNEDEINPIYWDWFFEAAAELINVDYNNGYISYYEAGCSQLEGIKLSNFVIDTSLEETLYQNEIENFYQIFGACTDEQKKEIRNMFYALTILNSNSPGLEGINFYQTLKSTYNVEWTATENRLFEESLRGVVAISESKMFYNNLLEKINNKSVTLEDVFSVIAVYELELSRQLWYQTKYESLEYFLEEYTKIQTEFFYVLSINSQLDVESLKELYYLYNENYHLESINVSFLSNEENAFLNYISETRTGNKKDAILKVYDDEYLNLAR